MVNTATPITIIAPPVKLKISGYLLKKINCQINAKTTSHARIKETGPADSNLRAIMMRKLAKKANIGKSPKARIESLVPSGNCRTPNAAATIKHSPTPQMPPIKSV